MSRSVSLLASAFLATLIGTPALLTAQAGLVVQQHSTFKVAGITSADLQQTTSILGSDRAKTVTTGKIKVLIISKDASGSDITRLDQDQILKLNEKKRTYTVESLADVREALAKQQREMAKQADAQEKDDTRYYAVVDEAKRTGEKQVINGFSTEQALIKITVFAENTKTKEKSVAFHITADMWFDPSQVEAARVSQAFAMAQVKALGIDPTMATNPYAKWLTNVSAEMGRIGGYPIRNTITFEGPPKPAGADKPDEQQADKPPTSIGGALSGMFGKKKSEPAKASPNGGMVLFTSSIEVLSISSKAPAASEFEVPAGYTRKQD